MVSTEVMILLSWQEIIQLLREGENQHTEFKRSISTSYELGKEIVAFANSDGGRLVLGIDDKNGHLIGENITKDWIVDIAENICSPKISVKVKTIERTGKNIFLILIPKGNKKPYAYKGEVFIREGTHVKPCAPEIIQIAKPGNNPNEHTFSVGKQKPQLSKRQMDVLTYLQSNMYVNNREYRELYQISHKTAHLELVDLVDKRYLKSQGKGRSTCYILI